eukprot:TRINITY_DN45225_c0_g1_i1.p1 TRINITY_DN45225_c0_g1~~TRINITY_DN45225_c0_g1_i1.p1  ORF type:complete len:748 (+),score=144.46 TRINITY_DN45225_c0_g1_i1:25-2268(+)
MRWDASHAQPQQAIVEQDCDAAAPWELPSWCAVPDAALPDGGSVEIWRVPAAKLLPHPAQGRSKVQYADMKGIQTIVLGKRLWVHFGRRHLDRSASAARQPDVELKTPKASRKQALVVRNFHGQVFLVDLGSTHGTFLGKTKLTPYVPKEWRPGVLACFADKSVEVFDLRQPRLTTAAVGNTLLEAVGTDVDMPEWCKDLAPPAFAQAPQVIPAPSSTTAASASAPVAGIAAIAAAAAKSGVHSGSAFTGARRMMSTELRERPVQPVCASEETSAPTSKAKQEPKQEQSLTPRKLSPEQPRATKASEVASSDEEVKESLGIGRLPTPADVQAGVVLPPRKQGSLTSLSAKGKEPTTDSVKSASKIKGSSVAALPVHTGAAETTSQPALDGHREAGEDQKDVEQHQERSHAQARPEQSGVSERGADARDHTTDMTSALKGTECTEPGGVRGAPTADAAADAAMASAEAAAVEKRSERAEEAASDDGAPLDGDRGGSADSQSAKTQYKVKQEGEAQTDSASESLAKGDAASRSSSRSSQSSAKQSQIARQSPSPSRTRRAGKQSRKKKKQAKSSKSADSEDRSKGKAKKRSKPSERDEDQKRSRKLAKASSVSRGSRRSRSRSPTGGGRKGRKRAQRSSSRSSGRHRKRWGYEPSHPKPRALLSSTGQQSDGRTTAVVEKYAKMSEFDLEKLGPTRLVECFKLLISHKKLRSPDYQSEKLRESYSEALGQLLRQEARDSVAGGGADFLR